jgi:GNAT superfamily N-acetyltransferase
MDRQPDSKTGPYLFRSMESKDDFAFVWKSWLRDYAHPRNPWSGAFTRDDTIAATKRTVSEILQRDDVFVVMVCPEFDRDQFFGFVCFEVTEDNCPVLHYVYVKARQRRKGLGTMLKNIARGSTEGRMRYTFRTPVCSKFLREAKHDWNLVRGRYKEKRNDQEGPSSGSQEELADRPGRGDRQD